MSSKSQSFFELVTKGSQQLAALSRLCDQEKAAIESHSADQLRAVVEDKKKLLLEITENITQRNQILTESGFPASDEGLQAFLNSLSKTEAGVIDKAWKKLSQQLDEVARQNERNEKIVLRSQKNMEQLMAILQGHSTKTTLYNQSGSKGNYSPQNTLGKA